MQNLMNNETLYNNILAACKEFYFEEIKQRIRRGKECNALNCHYNGGTVPYGYSVNEKREYVVDPLTAPVVIEIFEQFVNGQSVRDIQRALNTQNVAGEPLSVGRIRRMLKSRIYIGEYRYSKYMLRNTAQKASPQVELPVSTSPKDFLGIGLEKDEKLKAYWNGARPHGNESEDDAGFMAKLLYWCNNDVDRAIQAFCDSPYASQKDEKHQTKIKRLDYLPNLAKAMKPSRTAAQDNEEWNRTYCQPARHEASRGLNIISAPELQKANFPATKYLVEIYCPRA